MAKIDRYCKPIYDGIVKLDEFACSELLKGKVSRDFLPRAAR